MEFKGKLTNAIRTFENDYILEIKANAEQCNESKKISYKSQSNNTERIEV